MIIAEMAAARTYAVTGKASQFRRGGGKDRGLRLRNAHKTL
jgi:hypothetical protein